MVEHDILTVCNKSYRHTQYATFNYAKEYTLIKRNAKQFVYSIFRSEFKHISVEQREESRLIITIWPPTLYLTLFVTMFYRDVSNVISISYAAKTKNTNFYFQNTKNL